MTPIGGHLAVRPELCDRCGLCVRACAPGHLRVGGGYIYVDASACNGCFACVEVCESGAIVRRSAATKLGAHASGPGEAARVVVGSRAEAKALRKAAEAAERERAKATPRTTRAPQATAGPVAWGALDASAVAAVLLVSYFGKEAVLGSRAVSVMPAQGQLVALALVLGGLRTVQIALLAFLAHRRGHSLVSAFRLKLEGGEVAKIASSVGLVIALLFGTRFVSTLWGALAQAAGWVPPASEALPELFGGGGVGLALTVVIVVVLAPIAEELAFRGVFLTALERRWDARIAIVGSAAVFALYHMTPWVLVPTFVLGLALGWLALTRKTLLPAIALHALYNGVVVAAAFSLPA